MTEKPFKYAKEFEGKIVNKLKKGTGGYAGKGIRSDYVELKDLKEVLEKQFMRKPMKRIGRYHKLHNGVGKFNYIVDEEKIRVLSQSEVIETQKVKDLKIRCCHATLFDWGCTETTGKNAPNGKPLNCKSCKEFEKELRL